MTNSSDSTYDLGVPIQHQLRLTARIALAVSVMAGMALLVTLYFLFKGQQQENYLLVVQSLTQSQDRLLPAMLIGAALITLLAGVLIWSVLLYSSARIAGPLHRFKENVRLEINEGPVSPLLLRENDYLQELSIKLAATASGLEHCYDRQRSLLEALEAHIDSNDEAEAAEYVELLNRLKRASGLEQS